jgi:hypothetical protein
VLPISVSGGEHRPAGFVPREFGMRRQMSEWSKAVCVATLLLMIAMCLPLTAQRYDHTDHHGDFYQGAYRGGHGGDYSGGRGYNRNYDNRGYDANSGGIGPGKGAAIGAAGGAVLGAIFGGGLKGAIIGGAAGAGTGSITTDALTRRLHIGDDCDEHAEKVGGGSGSGRYDAGCGAYDGAKRF